MSHCVCVSLFCVCVCSACDAPREVRPFGCAWTCADALEAGFVGEVRAALHTFCEKWVPPAAEPEKAAVLGPLKLLEAMREEGAWENAQ